MMEKYAHHVLVTIKKQRHSEINKWKDLSISELKSSLGFILYKEIIVLPQLQDYWKTDPLFRTEFTDYMSKDCFL